MIYLCKHGPAKGYVGVTACTAVWQDSDGEMRVGGDLETLKDMLNSMGNGAGTFDVMLPNGLLVMRAKVDESGKAELMDLSFGAQWLGAGVSNGQAA